MEDLPLEEENSSTEPPKESSALPKNDDSPLEPSDYVAGGHGSPVLLAGEPVVVTAANRRMPRILLIGGIVLIAVITLSIGGFLLFRKAPDALARDAFFKFLTLESYTVATQGEISFTVLDTSKQSNLPSIPLPGVLTASLISRFAPDTGLALNLLAANSGVLNLEDAPSDAFTFEMAFNSTADIIPVLSDATSDIDPEEASFSDYIIPNQDFAYFAAEGDFAIGAAFGEGTTARLDSAGAMRLKEDGQFYIRMDSLGSSVTTPDGETLDVFGPPVNDFIGELSGTWYSYDISEFLDEALKGQKDKISLYTAEEEEELGNLVKEAFIFEATGMERLNGDWTSVVKIAIEPDGMIRFVERIMEIQQRVNCEEGRERWAENREKYGDSGLYEGEYECPKYSEYPDYEKYMKIVEDTIRDFARDSSFMIWVGTLDNVVRKMDIEAPFSIDIPDVGSFALIVKQTTTYSNINELEGIEAPATSESIENVAIMAERYTEYDLESSFNEDAVEALMQAMTNTDLFGLGSARVRGRDAKRLSDLDAMRLAIEVYADQFDGVYPALTGGEMRSVEDGLCAVLVDAQLISGCPEDPNGAPAFYGYKTLEAEGEVSYELTAKVEDSSCGGEGGILGSASGSVEQFGDICVYSIRGGFGRE